MQGSVCNRAQTLANTKLWLQMKVASTKTRAKPPEFTRRNCHKARCNATCSPIQMPWRSTAPSHPSPPLPHETAVRAAGLAQGCSCTPGATSAERRRCCNLERKKEQGMEDRTGKRSTLKQEGKQTRGSCRPHLSAASPCNSDLPKPLRFQHQSPQLLLA